MSKEFEAARQAHAAASDRAYASKLAGPSGGPNAPLGGDSMRGKWPAVMVPSPRQRWFAVLVCYLDDSGEAADPVQTMAGLLSTADAWQEFEAFSRSAFESINLRTLHTVDLHHRRGEFDNWSSAETAAFANSFFEIIRKYSAFGVEASVLKRPFQQGKQNYHLKKEGSPIGMCFRIILDQIVKDEGFLDAEREQGVDLSFVVEIGHKNNREILDRFNAIKKKDPKRFGSLTFDDKHKRIALQAADFIAYFSRRIRTAPGRDRMEKDTQFLMTALGDLKFKPFFATEFGV